VGGLDNQEPLLGCILLARIAIRMPSESCGGLALATRLELEGIQKHTELFELFLNLSSVCCGRQVEIRIVISVII
jgi:hypothetical protein